MKLTPYRDILKMGKEAVEATLAAVRANSAKKQAELELARLEERIATLETEINTEASRPTLNFSNIIEKQDELALTERKRKQFQLLIDELFPVTDSPASEQASIRPTKTIAAPDTF